MKRCLSFLLILLLALPCFVPGASADGKDRSEYTADDWRACQWPGYTEICPESSGVGFIWKDEMLTRSSTTFSPEIAKVSAALSVLAYDKDKVESALTGPAVCKDFSDRTPGMGFTLQKVTNSRYSSTFSDNDHVAYTVARKVCGQEVLYVVPVRGTVGYEWYSNFNLGKNNGGKHLGFHLAADELLADLRSIFAQDSCGASGRHILLTGHSRGGAVANIIAAALIEHHLVNSNHLYCYTVACPAVSKSVIECPGIINFINKGDVVPTVPLEEWGYKRNGSDWKYGVSVSGDVRRKIVEESGEAYKGFSGTEDFLTLLTHLVPSEKDFFEPVNQIGANCIAYIQAGHHDSAHTEALMKKLTPLIAAADLEQVSDSLSTPYSFTINRLKDSISFLEETISLAEQFFRDIVGKDPVEALSLLGSSLRSRLEAMLGYAISTLADVHTAVEKTNTASSTLSFVLNNTGALIRLFCDAGGNPLQALATGHDQKNYFFWASATFLGYKGYSDGVYKKASFDIQEVETVGPYCFSDCTALTEVTFDGNLRFIGSESFRGSGISGVLDLPEGVLGIGRCAFMDCAGLTAVHLPDQLLWLAPGSFRCPNVTEVTLPVDVIGFEAFEVPLVKTIRYTPGRTGIMQDRRGYNGSDVPGLDRSRTLEESCITGLSTVIFEEGVLHIGDLAFDSVSGQNLCEGALTQVTLPSTLQSIGSGAFWHQNHLAGIPLPEGLNSLGEYCFQNSGLESVLLPASLASIPSECFSGCALLQSVTFSEGLTSIGERAFEDCAVLEQLTLPHTLTEIGALAFSGTQALREISVPVELCGNDLAWVNNLGRVETIHYLFGSTGLMPDKSNTDNSLESAVLSSLRQVDFEEGITRIGDYAFTGWGSNGIGSAEGALEQAVLPSTLTSIGKSAFHGQKTLKSIQLPKGLQTLGDSCFKWSGLQKAEIPASVTSLGKECFMCCPSLGLVRFYGDAPKMDGTDVFNENVAEIVWSSGTAGWDPRAEALDRDFLFCHAEDEPVISVPGAVEAVEESAFRNVGAVIFELGSGVKTIGSDAFGRGGNDILIRVPSTVIHIDENAFRSEGHVFIAAPEDSTARQCAQQQGCYVIPPAE